MIGERVVTDQSDPRYSLYSEQNGYRIFARVRNPVLKDSAERAVLIPCLCDFQESADWEFRLPSTDQWIRRKDDPYWLEEFGEFEAVDFDMTCLRSMDAEYNAYKAERRRRKANNETEEYPDLPYDPQYDDTDLIEHIRKVRQGREAVTFDEQDTDAAEEYDCTGDISDPKKDTYVNKYKGGQCPTKPPIMNFGIQGLGL